MSSNSATKSFVKFNREIAKKTGATATDPVHIAESQGRENRKARKSRHRLSAIASGDANRSAASASAAIADATLNRGERTTTRGQSIRLGGNPITSHRRLS